ncbi:AfsR/SARP family transcriptional regulator [Streptomyces sp. CC210A]|uniref:AfsR/SARP family transcriptional regulator n=1 Tax=Streptomyces sp. CC210A TaxID=2898184 RepID=UPI001F30BEDB|nr:AfsR/SARP family transcriptional regulator [Streptomyces sp. CC210A]
MRFELLGPLSITDGTDTVVLQPSKPTNLLAALLLHANGVVSAEYLQRAVWGEEQPATAKAALQTCVLRLRRLFAKHGVVDTPIEAVPGGYRISAGPRSLDLIGFRDATREASRLTHSPEAELRTLKAALALWRGSLLANVRSETLHRDEAPRLVEERLRTVERVCDLELSLGRCGEALVPLWSETRAHPGHERFHEQLIEALYRTGRQSEALTEYRRVKRYLREELGVDPSPGLRRLELAILRGDDLGPCADGPRALAAAGPATDLVAVRRPPRRAAASRRPRWSRCPRCRPSPAARPRRQPWRPGSPPPATSPSPSCCPAPPASARPPSHTTSPTTSGTASPAGCCTCR